MCWIHGGLVFIRSIFLTVFDDFMCSNCGLDLTSLCIGRFKGMMFSFPTLRFFPLGFTVGRFLRRHVLLNSYSSTPPLSYSGWWYYGMSG